MENFLPPVDHRRDEELPAVGAQPHDRREGGLHARVELDAEADRARVEPRSGPPFRRPTHASATREHAEQRPRQAEPRRTAGRGRSPADGPVPVNAVGELRRGLEAVGGQLLERARDGGIDVGRDRLALAGERAGSSVMTCARIAWGVGPVNGGSPASISYSTAPSA